MYRVFLIFLYLNININVFSSNKRLNCCGSNNSKTELVNEYVIKEEINNNFICEKSKIVEEKKIKYILSNNREIFLDVKFKNFVDDFKKKVDNNKNYEQIYNEIKSIFKKNNENTEKKILKDITDIICDNNLKKEDVVVKNISYPILKYNDENIKVLNENLLNIFIKEYCVNIFKKIKNDNEYLKNKNFKNNVDYCENLYFNNLNLLLQNSLKLTNNLTYCGNLKNKENKANFILTFYIVDDNKINKILNLFDFNKDENFILNNSFQFKNYNNKENNNNNFKINIIDKNNYEIKFTKKTSGFTHNTTVNYSLIKKNDNNITIFIKSDAKGIMAPNVSVNISYNCIYDKILNKTFLLILNEFDYKSILKGKIYEIIKNQVLLNNKIFIGEQFYNSIK